MKYFIILSSVLILFACGNSKRADIKPDNSPENSTTKVETYFTVSFVSIGEGVDTEARKEYDLFIAKYNQTQNIKLQYEIIDWGREGESDYCFHLKMDDKKQASFISESKKQLESSSLVRYSENPRCQQRKD